MDGSDYACVTSHGGSKNFQPDTARFHRPATNLIGEITGSSADRKLPADTDDLKRYPTIFVASILLFSTSSAVRTYLLVLSLKLYTAKPLANFCRHNGLCCEPSGKPLRNHPETFGFVFISIAYLLTYLGRVEQNDSFTQ